MKEPERKKKQYYHELTEKEAERLSEKREKQLLRCQDQLCFLCYGDTSGF